MSDDEKCGASYSTAIWGYPRPIVYVCELPKGHDGHHYGIDKAAGTYSRWPQVTITKTETHFGLAATKQEGTTVCRYCYFTPDKCICSGDKT